MVDAGAVTSRCAVVGGGVVGVAVARELTRRVPGASVTVYEKEDRLAAHQTGHNSGVVHAGLYYQPGSLKARLCRRGVGLLRELCAAKGVTYEECGKVVVAQDDAEAGRLRDILATATANGVPGVRLVGPEELREIEPRAVGVLALHSPTTAIVDYAAVTRVLAQDVEAAGGAVSCGAEVLDLQEVPSGVAVTTASGTTTHDLVVTCAGLQSDRLARRSGGGATPRIVPFFGDYRLLRPERRDWVRGLVYPVPDPRYPFLGTHLTRRVDGEVMIGPNAFLSLGREAYTRPRTDVRDLADTLTFGGFWRFAARNLPTAARESRSVLSTASFVADAARYVPGLTADDVVPGPRGIRAQAMAADGTLVDDFVVTRHGRLTHVRNAPSPGATSALAIAEHVVTQALADAR